MKTIINCITEFQTADHTMTQTFENGVVLVTCYNSGTTGVFIGKELKDKYKNLSVEEYINLQQKVQELNISI